MYPIRSTSTKPAASSFSSSSRRRAYLSPRPEGEEGVAPFAIRWIGGRDPPVVHPASQGGPCPPAPSRRRRPPREPEWWRDQSTHPNRERNQNACVRIWLRNRFFTTSLKNMTLFRATREKMRCFKATTPFLFVSLKIGMSTATSNCARSEETSFAWWSL